MSMAILYEIQLLTASLAVGVLLMAVYDVLRLFRAAVRHGIIWTGIEDACYWIFSGTVTFILLFNQNDGILRGFAILGVLTGMIAYNVIISHNMIRLLKKVKKYHTMKQQSRQQRKQQKNQYRK